MEEVDDSEHQELALGFLRYSNFYSLQFAGGLSSQIENKLKSDDDVGRSE